MKFKFISNLSSWIIPNKIIRKQYRKFFENIDQKILLHQIGLRYKKVVKNLKCKNKPYKVAFLINEISKWKAQSLYDLMYNSEDFKPIILLTIADIQKKISLEQKQKVLKENFNYFKNKGMDVFFAYDYTRDRALSLNKFDVDIVFYQQPYNIPKIQEIEHVSSYALTCYIPYYIPSFRNENLDYSKFFHKELFLFFLINSELEQNYKQLLKKEKINIDNAKIVGHTMLDEYLLDNNKDNNKDNKHYVIYAPHWSITHQKNENPVNLSTFEKSGKIILDYALKHPHFNWVFKPHPTLKEALLKIGELTPSEIDDYYAKWESFALCCYDSTYIDLFKASELLITDCNSFIVEYFITQKPIIHLISKHTTMYPYNYTNSILDSLYKVRSEEDLIKELDNLLMKKNDYKLFERKKICNSLTFLEESSAKKIMNILLETIK